MRDTFPGYYRPSETEFAELWDTCVFVLDTSVILNLYRYPSEARDDLLKILNAVADRLWIPHQVALEYQENRLGVMAEQVQRYAEVRKVVDEVQKNLQDNLAQLQLKKRHCAIDPSSLLQSVESTFNEFRSHLDQLEAAQPGVSDHDGLRDRIDTLLKGKVGPPPESAQELENLYQQGLLRYETKRPPGYMDAHKELETEDGSNTCWYGDLHIKRQYGDLLLWFQLIQEAKARSDFDRIIFVTDDDKEDWWWTVKSGGKKTIGPRPELIDEIKSRAGVSSFYMYNSERFMQFARQHLRIKVKPESIDQVRDVAQARRPQVYLGTTPSLERYREAQRAVLRWVQTLHPGDEVLVNERGFPDFVVTRAIDGARVGYEVKVMPRPFLAVRALHDTVYRGYYEVNEGRLTLLNVVVVVEHEDAAQEVDRRVMRLDIPEGVTIQVLTMYVDDQGRPIVEPARSRL